MRRLVYLHSAQEDLTAIVTYLVQETRNPALARAFVLQLRQQCSKLAGLPGLLGRARPELRPDLRSFPFKTYVIFFRYAAERLEIISVLEGHRDVEQVFHQATRD